jgi:putative tryptophan/tyrosine transport system substrate-binding protein
MRRREFIALVGGTTAAAACPRHIHAQPSQRFARVGYLAPGRNQRLYDAFVKGLGDLGYVEGRHLTIIYRSADGRPEMLDTVAAELVRLSPDVVVTLGATAARAMQRATSTIPIVFAPAGDAVPAGLVQSLARPGGNATGFSINTWELNPKRLELLKETFPAIQRVAVLGNANNPSGLAQWDRTKPAAEALRIDLRLVMVKGATNLLESFSDIGREGVDALHVLSDAEFDVARDEIVARAASARLPATYEHRAFVEAGGLMSYGPNLDHISYRAAAYVDRILKGTKPGELPVEQPTTLELAINLKTAKALGLDIPPTLLARADEVIE